MIEIQVIENTVLATFETDVNAELALDWTVLSSLIVTDNAGTLTYSIMLQRPQN